MMSASQIPPERHAFLAATLRKAGIVSFDPPPKIIPPANATSRKQIGEVLEKMRALPKPAATKFGTWKANK